MRGNGEKFPLPDAANAIGNAGTVFQTLRRHSFLVAVFCKIDADFRRVVIRAIAKLATA